MIEKLTGMTASQAFQARIFTPLGLKNTLLPEPVDSSIPQPHPQGYSFGSNTPTVQTYALLPEDQKRALDGPCCPITRRWRSRLGDGLRARQSRPSMT